jgi:hypothetical protein
MGLLLTGMQEVGLDVLLSTNFSPIFFGSKRGKNLIIGVL